MPLFLNVIILSKLGEECGIYLFLFFTYIFTSFPQSIHEKNVWTNEIPTKKKYFGRTKYPILTKYSREKFWTYEITTRKNSGLTNYPRKTISDPQNTHEKKF